MTGDVAQIIRVEVELRADDVLADVPRGSEVAIGGEVSLCVGGAELDAVLLAVPVVERRENDRRTELSLVDQVDRLLVVRIHADRQAIQELLLRADVVVVRSLREGRVRLQVQWRARRVLEQGDVLQAHELERWGREVAGIARVDRRPIDRFPHEVHAGAGLAAAGIGRVPVEPQTVVHREGRQELPLILQVDALHHLRLLAVVDDRERDVVERVAVGIGLQDLRVGPARGAVVLEVEPATDGVAVGELIRGVVLQPERHIALEGGLRDAVVEQLAQRIRRVGQARVTRRERCLSIEVTHRMLPAHDPIVGDLGLVLVQELAREVRLPIHCETE